MGRRPTFGPVSQFGPGPGYVRVLEAIQKAAEKKDSERRRTWEASATPVPYISRPFESVTFPQIEREVLDTEPLYVSRPDLSPDTEKRRRARAKFTAYHNLQTLVQRGLVLSGPEGYRITDDSRIPAYLLRRTQDLSRWAYRIWVRETPWKRPGDPGLPRLEIEKIAAKDLLVDWFKETLAGIESVKVPAYETLLFYHVVPPRIVQLDRRVIEERIPGKDPEKLTDDDWNRVLKMGALPQPGESGSLPANEAPPSPRSSTNPRKSTRRRGVAASRPPARPSRSVRSRGLA